MFVCGGLVSGWFADLTKVLLFRFCSNTAAATIQEMGRLRRGFICWEREGELDHRLGRVLLARYLRVCHGVVVESGWFFGSCLCEAGYWKYMRIDWQDIFQETYLGGRGP